MTFQENITKGQAVTPYEALQQFAAFVKNNKSDLSNVPAGNNQTWPTSLIGGMESAHITPEVCREVIDLATAALYNLAYAGTPTTTTPHSYR